jgi:hypothetical protein
MAAPQGNDNAKKAKVWSDALRKYITQNPKDLEAAAKALIAKAKDGDVSAIKELGDRLEGKAMQSVAVSGDSDNPLVTELVVRVVKAGD